MVELDKSGSGEGLMVWSCENSDKPSGSIKDGEFLDRLSEY
jgi:hypothetical protein